MPLLFIMYVTGVLIMMQGGVMRRSSGAEKLVVENPAKDIRIAAMNLLARREHSYYELISKLTQRFIDNNCYTQELIQQQLQRLCDDNLQSDERFVEVFINSKINSGKGPLAIRQQLQQKGIGSELIEQGLELLEDEWYELAAALYRRKFADTKAVDQKEKAKRIRFLQGRGFLYKHFSALLAT